MSTPTITRVDASTVNVSWKGWGHPNTVFAEPGLQAVGFRTCVNIWRQPTVKLWCDKAGKGHHNIVSLAGSKFPTHALWINSVVPPWIKAQGLLSDLWTADPNNITFVK